MLLPQSLSEVEVCIFCLRSSSISVEDMDKMHPSELISSFDDNLRALSLEKDECIYCFPDLNAQLKNIQKPNKKSE